MGHININRSFEIQRLCSNNLYTFKTVTQKINAKDKTRQDKINFTSDKKAGELQIQSIQNILKFVCE